jgi:uncharacterized surface protein with fasciclin (FAS1) repeats
MPRFRAVLVPATLATAALATIGVTPATPAAGEQAIAQTVASTEQFSTLAKLLKTAGLASTLAKPGPYTVFAPTNAAFAKVPKSTLDGLLKDRAALRGVLLYHVVSGDVPAAQVVKLRSATTLNGKRVRIRASGGSVFVNSAKVTRPDVASSNGVIHVVNRVLVPPPS